MNRPVDIDGLSLQELTQLNHRVVERIKMRRAMQAPIDRMAFNLGAKVSFDTDHGRVEGTLVKYNRKTVNAVGENGRHYRVTPGLLSAVKDVGIPTPSQSMRPKKKNRLR